MTPINRRVAVWTTRTVGTMACAYVFAMISLFGLPEALHESFGGAAINPLPMVSWLSQNFLQLVLLSIIMVGQDVQASTAEERSKRQFAAVMETVTDIREVLKDVQALVDEDGTVIELLNKIDSRLAPK